LLHNYFETKIPQASTEHIAVTMRQLLQQVCEAFSLNTCGRRYTTYCVLTGEISARTVLLTFRTLATALTTLRPVTKEKRRLFCEHNTERSVRRAGRFDVTAGDKL